MRLGGGEPDVRHVPIRTQTSDPMADGAAMVTDDAFFDGGLHVRQPERGYRAGLDSLLLAAAVPIDDLAPSIVVDMGAGVGTVGLAIATRCRSAEIMLLERDGELARIARANVAANALGTRVRVIEADVGGPAQALADAGLLPDSVDHAVANPPYFTEGHGTTPARAQRAISRQMPEDGIEVWLKCAARAVRPGGTLTLIHRTEALARLLAALDGRFGGVQVKPIAAHAGDPATRILLHARKGSRAPLSLLSPLVTHGPAGFSEPVAKIVARPVVLGCFR